MIKNDLIRRIGSLVDELSSSQRAIANYVLNYPNQVIEMTVTELAEAAHSSPASVMRFCQSIKVSSYPLFKLELAAAINEQPEVLELEIQPNESIQLIKKKLIERSYQAMQDTLNYLTDEVLEKAIRLIKAANIMYVFGSGASYLVAENITQKWTRVGKVAVCESDIHNLATRIIANEGPAVLILISNSGETKESLLMMEMAKQHGMPVISITQLGNNSLAREADVAIQTVKANEAVYRSAATTSLHVQFLTVDVLFFYYISGRHEEVLDMIHKTRDSIKQLNE